MQPEPLQALEKRGPEEPLVYALGRSRGGLTTKIHMVCDANGVPLRFMLSPGQASDIAHAQPLLDQVRISGKPERPGKRSRWLLADKGYDAEHRKRSINPTDFKMGNALSWATPARSSTATALGNLQSWSPLAAVLMRGAATHRALGRWLWRFQPSCKVEHWQTRIWMCR